MIQQSITRESRMRSFATILLRKLRKVDYKNVNHIPGYEVTEKEYISLRQSLNDANEMIKDLMNYEYGNKYIKMIKSGLQAISDSTVKLYKSNEIYEDLSLISRKIQMISLNSDAKDSAEKFSTAFSKISQSKINLNSKLESIRLQLKEKRKLCTEIDKYRKNIKNMRFNLEVLLQDEGYNGEIREAEKKEFSTSSNQTLKMMLQFIEDAAISTFLKSIANEYASHMKEASEILKKSGN
jgi:hypothetical protein